MKVSTEATMKTALAGNGAIDLIAQRDSTRRVMPNEAQAAKFIVEEEFKRTTGIYPPVPCGYFVYVRVYQRESEKTVKRKDGSEATLVTRSLAAVTEDKYQSCSGLVVGVGPQAYTGRNTDGTERYPDGPWCKVGDWVIVPRYEGFQITYGDFRTRPKDVVPLMIIADDKIMGIIPDPEFAVATHLLDR